MGERLRITNIE